MHKYNRSYLAAAGAATTLALAACGSSSHPGAATGSVHAATVRTCEALSAWVKDSPADQTANDDPAFAALEIDAENTPLETDLETWINDLDLGVPQRWTDQDANKLVADCGAVGIAIHGGVTMSPQARS